MDLWNAVLADLRERGVPTDDVRLVSAQSVTWNDGSLGCPEAGQSYTQALTPGWRIVVRVADTTYDYRVDLDAGAWLCTNPNPNGAVVPTPG